MNMVTNKTVYVEPKLNEYRLEYCGFLCLSPIDVDPNVIEMEDGGETELIF